MSWRAFRGITCSSTRRYILIVDLDYYWQFMVITVGIVGIISISGIGISIFVMIILLSLSFLFSVINY